MTVLTSTDSPKASAKVVEVIVNEGYRQTLDNDLGSSAGGARRAPVIKITMSRRPTWQDHGDRLGQDAGRHLPDRADGRRLDLEPSAACNSGIKSIYAHDLKAALGDLSHRMRYSEKGINAAANAIAADMSDPLTGNMICAGTDSGERDACNGDSGGPLFMTGAEGPVQVGVVSWGEGPSDGTAACGHKNAYGIYTRLANYTGWIEEKMKTAAPAVAAAPKAGLGTAKKP